MNVFLVKADLLQNIFNYLSSKPYGEVVNLISAIQQLKPEPQDVAIEPPKPA